MAITLERLRMWILVAGVVLILAIASFFMYARYRLHQYAHDLPGKLGLEIQQSTNGFTVSRSHAGHTQFVLHAAKAVQYKNGGHLVLHDVSIMMYGKDGSRADHIAGSQFDYDQSSGIARADGAVDIELASPVSSANPAGGSRGASLSKADNPVKVRTSGLVFNQKTQVASTDQALEFQDGAATGSARGAIYDSANGTLDLASDVVLKTTMNDGEVNVKAQSANFNRVLKQLILIKSLTEYDKEHATSDQSTVYFRPDGAADHVLSQGNVHVVTDDGTDMHSSEAIAQLDEQNKLKQIRLNGGVLLVVHTQGGHGNSLPSSGSSSPGSSSAENHSVDSLQTLHADSNSAILNFGAENRLQHVQLDQAVSVVDQQVGLANDPHGSETREMRSARLDVSFEPDASGRSQPKNALATGEALVTVHTIHAAAPQQSTTLKGDQLFATLTEGHKLSSLRGDGHTYLLQQSPGGISQTSSADNLLVKFSPAGNAATSGQGASAKSAARSRSAETPLLLGRQGGSQIESALQQGHAVLVQLQPSTAPGAPPVKTTATADTIRYDGASGRISLTGGTPRITQGGTEPAAGNETGSQPSSELTATAIEFNRLTGDGSATGGIKASYDSSTGSANAPSGNAMHVIADHASLDHAKDETTFFGAPNADARLWQGANAITAPTIILARTRQLLIAQGPARGVKATFAEGPGKSGKPDTAQGTAPSAGGVMRITSSGMTYSGGERKASFTGGVTGQDATGTLHAASLDVYLAPERAASAKAAPVSKAKSAIGSQIPGPGGQIDHIISMGHVEFQQGERKATGDKLIYTADDEHFVLTGTAEAPPRVTDPVHGTVTGSSLIFNNRDDSVVVSRGQSATVTDTRTTR